MKPGLIVLAIACICNAQDKWYDIYAHDFDIDRRIDVEDGIFSHNYSQDGKQVPEALIMKKFKAANRFPEDVRKASILMTTGGATYLGGLFVLTWPLFWNLANRSDPEMQVEYKYWGYTGVIMVAAGVLTIHVGDGIFLRVINQSNNALPAESTNAPPGAWINPLPLGIFLTGNF